VPNIFFIFFDQMKLFQQELFDINTLF